jgi:hypothetical protein
MPIITTTIVVMLMVMAGAGVMEVGATALVDMALDVKEAAIVVDGFVSL